MTNMKKILWLLLLLVSLNTGSLLAQTSSFNFSRDPRPVSGWINLHGDPATASTPITATDVSTGITVSSIGSSNWANYNGGSSADDGGQPNGTFFPAAVMMNHWFQFSNYYALYNALVPQLEISGLNVDSVYTLKMSASFSLYIPGTFSLDPIRYTVKGAIIYGYVDVNGNFNTASGAVFNNVAPDASGKIKVYVNTYNGSNIASISGMQVIRGRTTAPVPTVSITHPDNNDVLPEDGTFIISATASEINGSIARVEFYVDSTKVADDSVAPYSYTWVNPDEGHYTLRARAVDGLGNTNTASINVSVESLSSFWSMTGNINMNPDSNFVGNVDSVRLAFRTKNIERMSISPTGNVGIGTINPTAQLHTTGAVRLAGLTNDSTKDRILVSDTTGKLFYRSASGLTGRWKYANGTVYDSTDNIGIGTNNTQGYKLAVNGTAIFTKVKVKTAGTWPDYVFEKGYALPGLAELERYLATHKHLPDMVSAAEAQKDGIDVAAQQAALLKKVEELTLYLIEENKQLKEQIRKDAEQNDRITRLQQQIEALEKLIRAKK